MATNKPIFPLTVQADETYFTWLVSQSPAGERDEQSILQRFKELIVLAF